MIKRYVLEDERYPVWSVQDEDYECGSADIGGVFVEFTETELERIALAEIEYDGVQKLIEQKVLGQKPQ